MRVREAAKALLEAMDNGIPYKERDKLQEALRAALEADTTTSGIRCPLCGEDEFDALGLKLHYQRGWCSAWDAIKDGSFVPPPPRSGTGYCHE